MFSTELELDRSVKAEHQKALLKERLMPPSLSNNRLLVLRYGPNNQSFILTVELTRFANRDVDLQL